MGSTERLASAMSLPRAFFLAVLLAMLYVVVATEQVPASGLEQAAVELAAGHDDFLELLGEGEVEESACGIKNCNADFFLSSPSSDACACTACTDCAAATPKKYQTGGCPNPGNATGAVTQDSTCAICSTCAAGEFMATACAAKADTVCSACTKCCPASGDVGFGEWCKAENAACAAETDTQCAIPTDWTAKVLTGMGASACGVQCGTNVADGYTSTSTWNFHFKDQNNQLIFQGQPQITTPCADTSCTAPADLTTQPRTSNGHPIKTVTVMTADGGDDSWCMQSICVHSASAGVKYEYVPTSSVWMNPGVTGPCGGTQQEWTFELVGPSLGSC